MGIEFHTILYTGNLVIQFLGRAGNADEVLKAETPAL